MSTAKSPSIKKTVACDADSAEEVLEGLSFRECLRLLVNAQPLGLPLLQVVFMAPQDLRAESWYFTDKNTTIRVRDKTKFCQRDVVNSFIRCSVPLRAPCHIEYFC